MKLVENAVFINRMSNIPGSAPSDWDMADAASRPFGSDQVNSMAELISAIFIWIRPDFHVVRHPNFINGMGILKWTPQILMAGITGIAPGISSHEMLAVTLRLVAGAGGAIRVMPVMTVTGAIHVVAVYSRAYLLRGIFTERVAC
jgi:hypothetical protein